MAINPSSFSKYGSNHGAWFSVTNHVDRSAIIDATTFIEELPPSNLTGRNADTIYRVTGIDVGSETITIDFDFQENVKIDVLAFMTTRTSDPVYGDIGGTLHGSDTVRHYLSTVSAGAGDVYDSGNLNHGMAPGHGVHCHLIGSQKTARYWRMVIFAGSKINEGEMDFTRAWAGEAFSFDINGEYGASIEWLANSNVVRAERSATDSVDVGDAYREINMTFSGINQNEFNSLLDFDRITSGQSQILFGTQKTDLGRFALFGRSVSTGGITYTAPGRFRKRLKIVESL